MNLKNVIIFSVGMLFGGACGFFGAKKMLEKKYHDFADEEIENVIDHYNSLYKDIESYSSEEEINDPDFKKSKTEDRKYKKPERHLDPTNYASYFEDKEMPTDEDSDEMFLNEYEDYRARHMDDDPKEMDDEEIGDLPPFFDHQILKFYTEDLVVSEEDTEIVDYERLVGNCLEAGDFTINDDRDVMFVVNYDLETIYEIQKVHGAFIDMTPV